MRMRTAGVRSAISLGKSLDLRVVAEGVEDDATLDELRRLQCDEVQGYLIGPGDGIPLP
jgi:diguanylate cyclase